jgi:REP element-mobilizing transposase RayT
MRSSNRPNFAARVVARGVRYGPDVTAPRQILPGTTWLVTRRCSERRNFLRPSKLTNEIFLYVLAVAASRYEILVHAACVMSNHYHLIVTDPGARLPAFAQYLNALVARATNASLGRWEGFWASGTSYSAVSNESGKDAVRKTAYVLANPVAAGLVQNGREWPGVRTDVDQLGAAKLLVERPEGFFRDDGDMPPSAELELTPPPMLNSPDVFRREVAAELARLEHDARRAVASRGRTFLGRKRVLAQSPYSRAEPGEPRRKLNPRVAAHDPWKRVEALSRVTGFVREYREALCALRAGFRDVLFPAGTYLMRVAFGVRCHPG